MLSAGGMEEYRVRLCPSGLYMQQLGGESTKAVP